ncbi:MAG: YbaN family protein [Chloroflexota bacterium]|nr:YbaN family protein [Chloroflexota bacterium]
MIKRYLYLALGFICVGLGFVGIFVPGLPTTVFVLVAAWAFSRSSERFERWLLEHRIFGSLIQNWRQYRGISVRSKITAVGLIIPTFGAAVLLTNFPILADIVFVSFGMVLCAFLVSRPVPPSHPAQQVVS